LANVSGNLEKKKLNQASFKKAALTVFYEDISDVSNQRKGLKIEK
jgi:hypothetical protein